MKFLISLIVFLFSAATICAQSVEQQALSLIENEIKLTQNSFRGITSSSGDFTKNIKLSENVEKMVDYVEHGHGEEYIYEYELENQTTLRVSYYAGMYDQGLLLKFTNSNKELIDKLEELTQQKLNEYFEKKISGIISEYKFSSNLYIKENKLSSNPYTYTISINEDW